MGDNTTHALLSPSKRHRWGACPGSIREEAKYPESSGGAAANDGTRTHALLERCIEFEFVNKEGVCGPAPFYGSVITDEFGTYTVDLERANRVNVAMEYIRGRIGDHPPIPEKRVFPDGLVERAGLDGTVDVQIPGKNIYEIIDYKDGMSPVAAKDNPQLEQYALGVLAGLAPENYPKTVRMTIIQPKLALRGIPAITSHDVPVAELLARVPVIKAEAAATDDPNAPLVPGESQCKYCRAKGACPALAGKVMQEVNLMFQPVPSAPEAVTPEVIPAGVLDPAQQAAAQDPTVMSDEQLRQIQEAAPLVNQLLKGVEEEILRRALAGKPVPGFKVVRGRGSRQWALPEEEIAKKLQGMGMPKTAVYKTELVSPAQAEKVTWEKKGEQQKLSDKQIERMQKEYITSTPGKLTIAPESDPRPAVVTDASPMFGDITKQVFEVQAPPSPVEQTVPSGAELNTQIQEVAAMATEPAPLPEWLSVPAWLQ